jgi:hypothetical protein
VIPSTPAGRLWFLAMVAGLAAIVLTCLFGDMFQRRLRFYGFFEALIDLLWADDANRASHWVARGGLLLAITAYAFAYHYDRTAGALIRWVRTGRWFSA